MLDQLGCNASQFINGAYDHLIKHGESPFAPREKTERAAPEQISQALAEVEDMCLPAQNRFATMGDDEIRRERLGRGSLA